MITREQVADLCPGDVVEVTRDEWPPGSAIRGPLSASEGLDKGLYILGGFFGVRDTHGQPYEPNGTLTVVSRAPRPLYVNSDRTEPVQGDVVRFEDLRSPDDSYTNLYDPHGNAVRPWLEIQEGGRFTRSQSEPYADAEHYRVTLLVDGTTGQAVTS